MKRSSNAIRLLIIPALALAACEEKDCSPTVSSETPVEIKHCVDSDGVVMDEAHCKELHEIDGGEVDDAGNPIFVEHDNPPPNDDGTYHPRPVHIYHWYYGGTNQVLVPGTRVSGGTFTPRSGVSYSSPSVVSRGGFGTIGRGVGVGAGE